MSFFGRGKQKSSRLPSKDKSFIRNILLSKKSSLKSCSPTSDSDYNMGNRHSRTRRSDRTDMNFSHPHPYRGLGSQDQSDSLWVPPPYSATPPTIMSSKANKSRSSGDSPYAFLKEFDTVFVVDDSWSMQGSRWKEAENAIAAITPVCTEHDPDGIDIYFLNHRNPYDHSSAGAYTNVTAAAAVREIFKSVQPSGATPFGNRLQQILKPYLRRVEAMTAATDDDGVLRDPSLAVRPLNIIAITDGAFTDDAESVILDAAKRLTSDKCKAVPWQVGIQFFQIGDDEAAREHLQELDDELSDKVKNEKLRDIVDTVPWRGERGQTLSGEGVLKVVLGAVNKKYDRRDAVHG
ncbi:hypothetical protein VTN00DRAFT_9251 [Thermoascus crustaceus]|uniref:uncharacterized protein n=1 Tax=Thermoascus crustaceus TaxID=5088 RepID=UPI003741EA4F